MVKSPVFSSHSGIDKKAHSQKVLNEFGNIEAIDSDGEWNEVEDDDNANMLEAIKKDIIAARKATKPSISYAAFKNKKESLYSAARKNAREIFSEGTNVLDSLQAALQEMKSQESSFERYRADCHLPILAHKELFEQCQGSYPPLLQELGHQRSTTVNAAGTTLKESVPARQAVLNQFSKSARIQLEQAKQNEKDAVDAAELIKHVKGLLRV